MCFGDFVHALDRFFRRWTLFRGRAETNRLRFAPRVELYITSSRFNSFTLLKLDVHTAFIFVQFPSCNLVILYSCSPVLASCLIYARALLEYICF